MKAVEFGQGPVIVLLHGGGLSWWSYREAAQILAERYHVVIPFLDGHAGSDRDFTSIADNARAICEYVKDRFGGHVYAMGGLSLGGQILVELLSQCPDICQLALIESALVLPMPMTHALVGPSVKMSYGLIRRRWFARLQFRQLRLKEDCFEDYYRDSCCITRENMISFLESNSAYRVKDTLKDTRARVIIVVGGKEQQIMKKSSKLLHGMLPNSQLYILPGLYHGEFSMKHPADYAAMLEK
ncbi:MAG: alpha/beta hydrolase [Eubacteriales bacterium]|nr:alpha/beta hydrolase [Eubacteriales bacterium]